MQFFRQIHAPWVLEVIDKLKSELALNDDAWSLNKKRQQTIHVQRHTESIFLRKVQRFPNDLRNSNEIHESMDSSLAQLFPHSMACLKRIAVENRGELGRALYARLKPQSVVYPHVDAGPYYAIRDRYHLVVDSESGSSLRCGGEEVNMHNGELWWFDNKAIHDSHNSSDSWRTHLIVDLLPIQTCKTTHT